LPRKSVTVIDFDAGDDSHGAAMIKQLKINSARLTQQTDGFIKLFNGRGPRSHKGLIAPPN
jgi:hypothetical protein